MIVGSPATQAKAVDLLAIEVDFTAGQAVGPERIQREAMAQELHGAGLIRAAKIDDSTAWWTLQVERPRRRKGAALGVVFGIEQTVQSPGIGFGLGAWGCRLCISGTFLTGRFLSGFISINQ